MMVKILHLTQAGTFDCYHNNRFFVILDKPQFFLTAFKHLYYLINNVRPWFCLVIPVASFTYKFRLKSTSPKKDTNI